LGLVLYVFCFHKTSFIESNGFYFFVIVCKDSDFYKNVSGKAKFLAKYLFVSRKSNNFAPEINKN